MRTLTHVLIFTLTLPLIGFPSPGAARVVAADGKARSTTLSSHPHVGVKGRIIQPEPIQAALDLLQWPPDRVPMIEVVEVRPPAVNVLAEGWVVFDADGRAAPTLYVAGWSSLYRAVQANRFDLDNTIRLASVLAHERAHLDHGANEELAYAAQLTTLALLHAPTIDRTNVRRALQAIMRQQGRPR